MLHDDNGGGSASIYHLALGAQPPTEIMGDLPEGVLLGCRGGTGACRGERPVARRRQGHEGAAEKLGCVA